MTPDPPDVSGKPGGTFRLGITEPTAIDPYNAQESEGLLVTKYLFTGLVQVKPDGTVYDGVASKWTPNADCSQWTFTLKSGTTFSNGEPVDAAAFEGAEDFVGGAGHDSWRVEVLHPHQPLPNVVPREEPRSHRGDEAAEPCANRPAPRGHRRQ